MEMCVYNANSVFQQEILFCNLNEPLWHGKRKGKQSKTNKTSKAQLTPKLRFYIEWLLQSLHFS